MLVRLTVVFCLVLSPLVAEPNSADLARLKKPAYFAANPVDAAGKRVLADDEVMAFGRSSGGGVVFTAEGALIVLDLPGEAAVGKTARGLGIRDRIGRTAVLKAGWATRDKRARAPHPAEPLAGKINHLVGPKAQWVRDIPTYKKMFYEDVWEGVDVSYEAGSDGMGMALSLAIGADPTELILETGTTDLVLSAEGDLRVFLDGGELVYLAPRASQLIDGREVPVPVSYLPLDNGQFSFQLGFYDMGFPLRIMPDLQWSTFVGGSDGENGWDLEVGPMGDVFVAGASRSTDFPTTPGSYDPSHNGNFDISVFKMSPDGTTLSYATYIGGSEGDNGLAMAVDDSGCVYVTGNSFSSDYPTTPGAFSETLNRSPDIVVTKLNSAGNDLVYSTFIGGSGLNGEAGLDMALDPGGAVYLCGTTFSTDFPVTAGAFDESHNGFLDSFALKLNAAGSALEYATFLGGTRDEYANALAADTSGNLYVTGYTNSTDFPTTPGTISQTLAGETDIFVLKLNNAGTSLIYGTYVGSSEDDSGHALRVDSAGRATIAGSSSSPGFPTTPGAFDTTFGGSSDAVFFRLDAAGAMLDFSTFLGGSEYDAVSDFVVAASGKFLMTGTTSSPNFPVSPDAYDGTFNDPISNVVLVELNSTASSLTYGTFLGSFSDGLAIDEGEDGTVFVAGRTSGDIPITDGVFDETHNGSTDTFVLAFGFPQPFDPNGDGCSNIEDLLILLPDWQQAGAMDPNGDGDLNILDFFLIDFDGPVPCP